MSEKLTREYLELCLYVKEYIQNNGNVDRAIPSPNQSIMQSDYELDKMEKPTIDVDKVLEYLNKKTKCSGRQFAHTSVLCDEKNYSKENNISNYAHAYAPICAKHKRAKTNKAMHKNTSMNNTTTTTTNSSAVNENKLFDMNIAYEQLLARLKTELDVNKHCK